MKDISTSLRVFLLFVVFFPFVASAHSGRTDSKGGHFNRRTGQYHYHNSGSSSGSSSSSRTRTTGLRTYRTKARTTYRSTARSVAKKKAVAQQKSDARKKRKIDLKSKLAIATNEIQSGMRKLQEIMKEHQGKPIAHEAKQVLRELYTSAKKEATSGDEKAAASRLFNARNLLKKNPNSKVARRFLEEILKKYPDTEARSEAEELLKTIKQNE